MKKVGYHQFCFGDELYLVTDYFDNGDGVETGLYTNQKLTLQGHGNSAIFELVGTPLTPKLLRRLANELEIAQNRIVAEHKVKSQITK